MSNQATGNSAHQPREGFMAPTFRIFVRTAEGAPSFRLSRGAGTRHLASLALGAKAANLVTT